MQNTSNKITPAYQNPVFEKTNETPEYEANKVIKAMEWDGSTPIDLVAVCEAYDFTYAFQPFKNKPNLPGTTNFYTDGTVKIFINTGGTDNENGFSLDPTTRRRQRFTLAHEIGHALYKSHGDLLLQKNLMDRHNPHARQYDRLKERQANEFASHLLLPNNYLNILVKQHKTIGKQLLSAICDQFDVSQMTAIQKLAGSAKYPCLGIIFNTEGKCKKLQWSKFFSDTGLYFPNDSVIPNDSACDSLHSGRIQDDYLKKRFPNPYTWFPTAKREDLKIIEHAFKLGAYGFACLLEIEED